MNSSLNFRVYAIGATTLALLCGCGAPTTRADNPDLFKEVGRGRVAPEKVQDLTDCVMDGFARSQRQGTSAQVVQQKRSTGYRAEVVVGPHLLLSADINQDGTTRLLEGYAAGLISTKKEIAEYTACVDRYQGTLRQPPIEVSNKSHNPQR